MPYVSKAVSLLQRLDGVDVCLFVMFVQEFGDTCPGPNRRHVYISYLDSVHYFRPRRHRTAVYQDLVVSYLEYVRRRGFTACGIWSCPPQRQTSAEPKWWRTS